MKSYDTVNPTIACVENFLSNRTQHVNVNRKNSYVEEVSSGIPQGSVLGPILFVIYINDLVNKYIFSDDSEIFNKMKCENEVEKPQKGLDRMPDWSNKWMQEFHGDKRKHLKTVSKAHKLNRNYKITGNMVKVA